MTENKNNLNEIVDRQLLQSENLYRFIVEHSHIGIVIIDDNFKIVFSNRELLNIMGYRLDEIINRDFRDFIIEEYKSKVTERYLLRQKGADLSNRYEIKAFKKDGTRKTLEISISVTKSFSDHALSIVQVFDITERKQMEAEIKKSRKKYHDIVHNMFDVIFIHDLDGVFRESNAHYVMELGGKKDFLVGKHIKEIMSESFYNEFDDYLDRIKKYGKDEGLFTIMIPKGETREGEQRTLEYRNFLVYDEDGLAMEVWGSARDITEHLKDKKALKASEEKYRTIVQNIEDIYYELDLAGNLLFFNEALPKNLGYDFEEAEGMHYSRYIAPDDIDQAVRYFKETYKAGKIGKVLSYKAIKKDGSIIHIETIGTVIKNDQGETIGFRGISRDVTERKRTETILRESEQWFREIIQGTPIPTFVITDNHVVTHWNKACEKLTGMSADDVINTNLHWKPFYPEKRPTLADLVLENNPRQSINANYPSESMTSKIVKGAYEVESFFPGLGSSGKWLLLTAAPLKNSEGSITGAIETLLDITEKKIAEQNLLEMHDDLEKKIKERTQGLEEANVALKVLLKKRESDRKDLGEQMVVNIREIIFPYIERLKNASSREMRKVLIEIIEQNLEDIASPFMQNLSVTLHKLTPSEIQIINLIKRNKTNKEIAELLNISPRTVETHRDNIRKKLAIKNQKINLKSYLSSIG